MTERERRVQVLLGNAALENEQFDIAYRAFEAAEHIKRPHRLQAMRP